jgi:hydroxypyruvate reductase/glycerate 2-kinase
VPGGRTSIRTDRADQTVARIENRARLTDHGDQELRATVLDLAEVALTALRPSAGLRRSVTLDGKDLITGGRRYDLSAVDRLVLLGAGKASAALAIAVEQLLGPRLDGGVVVVPRPAERPADSRLTVLPGEHPVPGPASVAGARALLEQAGRLGERDLAICVFTGGSSALASLPPPGITNTDKARLHRLLLSSGMSVVEINTVRKHVSLIKGGRLARAIAPARILNLTVSDVVDDPLDCITDPTVQDTSSVAAALSVLREWELLDRVPESVRDYLVTCAEATSPDLRDADIHNILLARGEDGTDAVLRAAEARGLVGVRLGGSLEGEAATAGRVLATVAREARATGSPWPRGTVVVGCGGECTVSLGPDADALFGQGGPSQEAAVGAALALDGAPGIVALFADTDGSDGGTAIAGGLVDSSTARRAREQGLSLRKGLVDHATTVLLEACGDAVLTGATQTNANDLIIIGVS